MIIIFCSAATASAALPSWRRPSTALNSVRKQQDEPGPELLQRVEAADSRDEQDDLHRVAVLPHERAPARLDRRLGELVRPDGREPRRGLGARQAARRIHAEAAGDLGGLERVPRDRPRRPRRRPALGRRHVRLLRWSQSRRSARLEAGRVERDRRAGLAAQQRRRVRAWSRSRPGRPSPRRTSRPRAPSAPSSPRRTPTPASAAGAGAADRALLRRAPVGVDGVDVGHDHERVGVQVAARAARSRGPCRSRPRRRRAPARRGPARRCT